MAASNLMATQAMQAKVGRAETQVTVRRAGGRAEEMVKRVMVEKVAMDVRKVAQGARQEAAQTVAEAKAVEATSVA